MRLSFSCDGQSLTIFSGEPASRLTCITPSDTSSSGSGLLWFWSMPRTYPETSSWCRTATKEGCCVALHRHILLISLLRAPCLPLSRSFLNRRSRFPDRLSKGYARCHWLSMSILIPGHLTSWWASGISILYRLSPLKADHRTDRATRPEPGCWSVMIDPYS